MSKTEKVLSLLQHKKSAQDLAQALNKERFEDYAFWTSTCIRPTIAMLLNRGLIRVAGKSKPLYRKPVNLYQRVNNSTMEDLEVG